MVRLLGPCNAVPNRPTQGMAGAAHLQKEHIPTILTITQPWARSRHSFGAAQSRGHVL